MVKLNGSSILETITAMSILLIITAIVFQTLSLIQGAGRTERNIYYRQLLKTKNKDSLPFGFSLQIQVSPCSYDEKFVIVKTYLNQGNTRVDSIKELLIK